MPSEAQRREMLPEGPEGLSEPLKALWHEAAGDWEEAHRIVQDMPGRDAAWIHAYLHRKEGDVGNADYWYARAGCSRPAQTLEEEWAALVTTLRGRSHCSCAFKP